MKNFLLIILLIFGRHTSAQNLIPNGDFELYNFLPISISEFEYCSNWFNPTLTTPDYFHMQGYMGAQLPFPFDGEVTVYPFSGEAVAGLILSDATNWREYVEIELSSKLIIDELYKFSIAITNGKPHDFFKSGSNHFGFLFSTTSVLSSTTTALNYTPTLEINGDFWDSTWQEVSFNFIADSSYKYLTIGNFYDESQTIATIHVPSSTADASVSYYFIDQAELIRIENNDESKLIEMPNVFTPNNDEVNEYFKPLVTKNKMYNIEFTIYNRWGEKVFESSNFDIGWDGKFKDEPCSEGTYYWNVCYTGKDKKTEKLAGFFTLIR